VKIFAVRRKSGDECMKEGVFKCVRSSPGWGAGGPMRVRIQLNKLTWELR
jgi:hypothetical protein